MLPDIESMLKAAGEALSEAASPISLVYGETLASSNRSIVVRAIVQADAPDTWRTVVVKAHDRSLAAEAPVREAASLALLTNLGRSDLVPRLLATSHEPALIVLEDLGPELSSLADRLLGTDARLAGDGLMAWAQTMGQLHVATSAMAPLFEEQLAVHAARLGVKTVAVDVTQRYFDEVASDLPTAVAGLNIEPSQAALDEVRTLPTLLGGGESVRCLTPADACPDNNVLGGDGSLLLFDFEEAEVRHVAWDAAYLIVPWPSCWCAWQLPAELGPRALEHWQRNVSPEIPYVATPAFSDDLSYAVIGWVLISINWFMERSIEQDWPGRSDLQWVDKTPLRRTMLQDRLALALRASYQLPALNELFAELAEATTTSWGPSPGLPLAPSFRS